MKEIFRKLGFTAKETSIIAFLFIVFIIGLVVKYSDWKTPDKFDYSGPDRQFGEKTKTDFDELKKNSLNELQKQRSEEIKNLADSLSLSVENRKKESEVKIDRTINLNTAYAADLMLLPGIGEVIADRIIDYREKNGAFRKVEDLKKVKGIGDKKFENIKKYISVE